MEELYNEGITIVFGDDLKYQEKHINDFLNTYQEFDSNVNEYLKDYKYIGPLKIKNKDSVLSILTKDPQLHHLSKQYISKQLDYVGASLLKEKYPLQLTQKQKEVISMTRDVLAGEKKNIFLCDDSYYYNIDMINFLKQSKEFIGSKVIWFTGHDIEKILKDLGNNLTNIHFYRLIYGKLTKKDFDGWQSIIEVYGIKYDKYNNLTNVSAKLIAGSVSVNDVLYHVYTNYQFNIIGDITYYDPRFAKKIVKEFAGDHNEKQFKFNVRGNDYSEINNPALLISKKK